MYQHAFKEMDERGWGWGWAWGRGRAREGTFVSRDLC